MYFIISESSGQFKSYQFRDSVVWSEMIAAIEGNVIELFQSNLLEPKHFDEYFNSNYQKKYGKTKNDSRGGNKSKVG
jgi:hypothetical protein